MNVARVPNQLFVNGQWTSGAEEDLLSLSPTDGSVVWAGKTAAKDQIDEAFAAARQSHSNWFGQPVDDRISICRAFANHIAEKSSELAALISHETGKPLWESRQEVATVVAKVELSVEALRERRDARTFPLAGYSAVIRYQPFGVMAVLGPFNFPAHLPNGHIVPALMAGNTVVFKPSEMTPAVGAWMVAAWQAVGLPPGVLNLVQGGRQVGQTVAAHPSVDGLLFTGSGKVGRALHRAFAENPQKILALEMGGNNPLVVHRAGDLEAAVYFTLLSAFITSGQRCTCARRLIVVEDDRTEPFVSRLAAVTNQISIGYFHDQPEPFMGPVISREAGEKVLREFEKIVSDGGRPIVAMRTERNNGALLSPGLLDITEMKHELADEEVFGPLLTLRRVRTFGDAIEEANRTKYGLSAGLLSDDETAWQEFVHRIRAGIVNWNRQTTGASGKLPFGGCGLSGNNRPAGYFSADYCSYAVASLESPKLAMPSKLEVGLNWRG